MHGEFLVSLDRADVALAGRPVLKDICWQIYPGQHWRVDGPNGAGKTTLLRTVAGLKWPVAATPPARQYRLNGKPTHLLAGVRSRTGYASYSMQDEYVRRARNVSVHEVLASGFGQSLLVYDQPGLPQQKTIRVTSARLGLSDLLDKPFLSLSHGQKSVVLFGRAIIHQPRLLILDEIFNGVDSQHFERMIAELLRYRSRGGQIVLSWHEHGISELENLFTHSLVLEHGRIVNQGEFIAPNRCINNSGPGINEKVDDEQTPLIELENIDVYLRNKPVLRDINWTICRGQRWLLKGENGAGKTTLLKVLLAEVRPAIGGRIARTGLHVRSTVWEIRSQVGYVSPELQQSYRYNISVSDAVGSGFYASIGLYHELDPQQQDTVRTLLDRFGLDKLARRGVLDLSSGQVRRVMLARALVRNPEILLLDEITSNLDRESRNSILALIGQLADEGRTMVFIGHHPQELAGLYNRVLTLHNGRIQTSVTTR